MEEARTISVAQLHALSGCAKGLTNNSDAFMTEDLPGSTQEENLKELNEARDDPRMVDLRLKILNYVTKTTSIWSADSETSDVRFFSLVA